MPGLITHYLLGKDVLGYIYDDKIKSTILRHKDAYNLGLQGPDFFFYDISHSMKSKGFNYGRLIHTNHTGVFFQHMLKGASLLSEKKRETALAYIYGFLCHFAMDCTAHPYIMYMACFKTENKHERQLSSTSHTYFETAIDTEMLLIKRGLTPNKLRRQDLIDVSEDELKVISHIFAYAFNKTFHQHTTAQQILNSIHNCYLTNLVLQDDKHIKISLFEKIEKSFLGYSLVTGIMYYKNARIKWDVLNRMNDVWCLPWDDTAKSSASFIDLYDDAALLASKLINDADSIINWGIKPDDFLDRIGNRSYITGVNCEKQLFMKHFRSETKDIVC